MIRFFGSRMSGRRVPVAHDANALGSVSVVGRGDCWMDVCGDVFFGLVVVGF